LEALTKDQTSKFV